MVSWNDCISETILESRSICVRSDDFVNILHETDVQSMAADDWLRLIEVIVEAGMAI